jgi:hypothetical protein
MMETFALFADATASRIVYGFFDPGADPVELTPLGITDAQVKHSAANGCFSAYQVLRRAGYISPGQKFALSYEFAEGGRRIFALGASAGLAFCLQFAQEIAFQATGKALHFSLAATGVISEGTEKAEVRGVEGMTAKLQAALACLQPGDKVFYPLQNSAEISPEIQSEATQKGIELIAVSTVAQAISRLLEQFPREAYPIVLEGLGQPVSELGDYQVTRHLFLGQKVLIPFQLSNQGNREVPVKIQRPDTAAGWLTVSPATPFLHGPEGEEIHLTIPSEHRFLFFLRHCWKLRFQREATLSLHCTIPEVDPYAVAKAIRVKAIFWNLWLPVLIGLFLLIGIVVSYYQLPPKVVGIPQSVTLDLEEVIRHIRHNLEQGRYLEAKKELERIEKRLTERDERIQHLLRQMTERLHLKINFWYLEKQSREASRPLPHGEARLRSGDGYRLEVTPDDQCFFYVYQRDAAGHLAQLFPNVVSSPAQNSLERHTTYWLPVDEQGNPLSFILDEQTGQETIYFVAVRWPAKDLESLFPKFRHPVQAEEQQPDVAKLMERLKARAQAQAAGIGGVFYQEYTFQHE